jgi:SPP1 family predicted phage head-tail adaptor
VTLGAGRYDQRAGFERRVPAAADEYGNVLPVSWAALFSRWAHVRPDFGREQLQAGRLESSARAVVTVRRDPETVTVTAADRITFSEGPWKGQIFNIRSITPVSMAEIEMTGEFGVAV